MDQNGFDTTQVSEEDQEMLEMRSYPQSHRACWGMYLSAGVAPMFTLPRELKEMVAVYEYKQSLLERMKREDLGVSRIVRDGADLPGIGQARNRVIRDESGTSGIRR